jgi:hypothetical protein
MHDDVRTETWEVGRLKSAKEIRVAQPQGGTTVSTFIFVWQALDAGGRASGSVLSDLSLDVMGCGTTREWVMVEAKPVCRTSNRGRSRTRGIGAQGRGARRGAR